MSCLVPDCNNTFGVPFPDDPELKKLWMEGLQFTTKPSKDDFVCLDHFSPSDIIKQDMFKSLNSESARSIIILKANAVPVSQIEETRVNTEFENTCRACGNNVELKTDVWDSTDEGSTIVSMMMLCCYPMIITKYDELPKSICSTCLMELRASYKFRSKCLNTDHLLKNTSLKRKQPSNESDKIITKRKCLDNESINQSDDNKHKKEVANVDNKNVCHLIDIDQENEEEVKVDNKNVNQLAGNNHENKEGKVDNENEEGNENVNQTVRNVNRENDKVNAKPKSQISEKINSNAELTAILSGEDLDEPILISIAPKDKFKDNNADSIEKELEKMYEMSQPSHTSTPKAPPPTPLARDNLPIILPKGIKIVNVPKKKIFESTKGTFKCTFTTGPLNTAFVLVDDYLLTIALNKGKRKYLKCVVPNCPASGEQNEDGIVALNVSHNHERPTNDIRKKQMLFHILRKRMQLDKSLNFRSVYEEVCKKEPEIRKLVPLRNIINEICENPVTAKFPEIDGFYDFYNKIEMDCFERLHFTIDGVQFYQERFETGNGEFAVVFCNTDVIPVISQSNLMFVDASFRIKQPEGFPYQLVTVMVWINECYYPTLFGLINRKSQEIFQLIFEHLHDVLAPDLRPHEIITDYEFSIYYALGATYVESHIGGSVYYYTQNLYKKVCSLNLARELEVNSTLRVIYHMTLMLPLLPVNTVEDAFNTIVAQANELKLDEALTEGLFGHIRNVWLTNVTPELFCVHRLENRINENAVAPFKKLRDLLTARGKAHQAEVKITHVVEKLIEFEFNMRETVYNGNATTGKEASLYHRKNVTRAWSYIETHPKININGFYHKALGYVKYTENQLWIWGYYGYEGGDDDDDELIAVGSFINYEDETEGVADEKEEDEVEEAEGYAGGDKYERSTIVMNAIVDHQYGIVIETDDADEVAHLESDFLVKE